MRRISEPGEMEMYFLKKAGLIRFFNQILKKNFIEII